MPVTRRLIGIEDALWQRVQDRAAADGRTLVATVGRLLRAGLAGGEPVLKTADEQLQQPRDIHGDPIYSDVMGLPSRPKPTVAQLRERVAHVPNVTPSEPWDEEHTHGRPLSPREIERRRIARQEFLRSHPEDEGQE